MIGINFLFMAIILSIVWARTEKVPVLPKLTMKQPTTNMQVAELYVLNVEASFIKK